jgi:hypothetical protein
MIVISNAFVYYTSLLVLVFRYGLYCYLFIHRFLGFLSLIQIAGSGYIPYSFIFSLAAYFISKAANKKKRDIA